MTEESDLVEVIDEMVDDLDPSRVAFMASRYGLTVDELVSRIVNELKARLP